MRQLGDFLVWAALFLVLAAVVYVTPQVARFMSAESSLGVAEASPAGRSMAFHPIGSSRVAN